MKKIIYILILFFVFSLNVRAEENLVNIYLFHSEDCIHCKSEIEVLNELEDEYSNIRVYKYEVSNKDNSNLFGSVTNLLNARSGGVPFTVIGGKYYNGFNNEDGKRTFVATIEYYSKYGYKDVVGEYIGNIELPTYEIDNDVIDVDSFVNDYGNYRFKIPLIGNVDTNDLDLSFIILLFSLKRLFSICFLLTLLSLIAFVIGIKDKKKLFIIGFIYYVINFIIDFISMLSKNMNKFIIDIDLLKYVLIFILIIYSLYKFIFYKKHYNKKNIMENKYLFSIIGIIILSILIGYLVLNYNQDINILLKNILYLCDVSSFFEIIYIFMYCLMNFVIGLLLFVFCIFIKKTIK